MMGLDHGFVADIVEFCVLPGKIRINISETLAVKCEMGVVANFLQSSYEPKYRSMSFHEQ